MRRMAGRHVGGTPAGLAAMVAHSRAAAKPLIGMDPGARYVGLSITSADCRLALPLRVVDRHARRADSGVSQLVGEHAAIHSILSKHHPAGLVVGLPLDSFGREGPACRTVRAYVGSLRLGKLPVIFLDERFTTANLRHALTDLGMSAQKQQRVKDTGAAVVILQSALDIAFAHAHHLLKAGGGHRPASL
eukprot:CAMPEP_0185187322 /NCGR_PEP_ID=MMETSP1140-20130426/4658_1 /TAXON_ID=298111 /ORGANISM="Pavlova sp., Strain CCMP459" /LENGTH=189 /DNA_ID=CAMNT_0027753701 /DNA_START=1 /DNA_END=570 /DNA_ORIENTATION=-